MTRIEGKVASVLNERELVLNVGEDDGVEVGMRFDILYPGGIEIPNPDDPSQTLGNVEWPKTQVKIVKTYAGMAIGRTFRTVTTPASGGYASLYAAISGATSYTPEKTTVETLRTDGSFAAKEIDESESLVKVGDPAVQSSRIVDASGE